MSSRSNNKGFAKNHRRYVPKTGNSPSKTTTLSASLRESDASSRRRDISGAGATSSAGSSRVRIADGCGNWAPGKQGGSFVNYLPQDEAVAAGLGADDGALDPVESQRVVDLLNRELSRLLKFSPRDFWREVAEDSSLHEFLDSYLKFRSRWYDFPHHGVKGIVAGVIVGDIELSRRVLMVLYRLSSNKDPGSRTSDSLSTKEHGALLLEKKLLDLPKLLDVCAIYSHDNKQLTESLVNIAIKSQPWLLDELTAVISHFLSITNTMHQRCSSSLEALFSSGGEDHCHTQLDTDFLEVMDFLNDAVASLDAFVDAYSTAAVYFSLPVELSFGNEEVLITLARLHDSLLPSLRQGFQRIFTAREQEKQKTFGGTLSDVAVSLKMLSVRIVHFGWKLLDKCYLSDDLHKSTSSAPLLTASKMFPAKVEDPVIRGDILLQTFREVNIGPPFDCLKNQIGETFLQNVEKTYSILHRVDSLRSSGWIFMDNDQFQYLSNMVLSHFSNNMEKPNVSLSSSVTRVQTDEAAAIFESKIIQMKDLFPEYGKGFLSACLEVYNQNPEEVIQRILEGTLHEDLLAIDTKLENVPPPKSASLSKIDKGKGALVTEEPTPTPSSNTISTSGTAMVGPKIMDGPSSSSSSSSSYGRYTRKSKIDMPDSKVLDSRGSEDLAKSLALASQYEYEDEYDDSFDDLGLTLFDVTSEETENLGDQIHSRPGISSRPEAESFNKNTYSKWQSQKKPQFYVKDGKNYSYKVCGSVATSNLQEAALVTQVQKELIHGLGRGGNLPLGAVKTLMESNNPGDDQGSETAEETRAGRGTNFRGRGRGRGRNNYRKDRAMKKHFAGLGGY